MNKHKFSPDKGGSQEVLNPNESTNNRKKLVASNADYYSEWAIETCTIEKPKSKKFGNPAKPASDNAFQTANSDQYY